MEACVKIASIMRQILFVPKAGNSPVQQQTSNTSNLPHKEFNAGETFEVRQS